MSSADEDDEVITVEEEDRPEDPWRLHCVATWRIAHFGRCQQEAGEELFSPMLSADVAGKIRWCLSICPQGQLSICVAFMASEPLDRLAATATLSILDSRSQEWKTRKLHGPPTRFQVDDFVSRDRLTEAAEDVLPGDVLTLRCHVAAVDPDSTLHVQPPSLDEHLRALADDIRRLYEEERFCDVTLEARDGEVRAHRALLLATSPQLAELLGDRTTLSLPDADRTAVAALVSYLYSGRIEAGALLDLCALAGTYELADLTDALLPDTVDVRTDVAQEEFEFTWRIRDPDWRPGTRRHSETFHSGPPSRAWYLTFRIGNDPDGDPLLSVHLHKPRASGDEKPLFVRFEVSVLDASGSPVHPREASATFRPGDRHGFPDFVRRSALPPGGVLALCCRLRISDGAGHSSVRHAFRSRSFRSRDQGALLSERLGALRRDGRDCDVTVCSPDRDFGLHRAVLCARSPSFADFFGRHRGTPGRCTINVQGIRSPVLDALFSFLYTGSAEVTPRCAPELLAAAEHYKVPGLERICSDLMSVRIREVASAAPDARTRDLVRDFVCAHADRVLVSEQWSELVREHPRLANEVLSSLARGYREAKRRKKE